MNNLAPLVGCFAYTFGILLLLRSLELWLFGRWMAEARRREVARIEEGGVPWAAARKQERLRWRKFLEARARWRSLPGCCVFTCSALAMFMGAKGFLIGSIFLFVTALMHLSDYRGRTQTALSEIKVPEEQRGWYEPFPREPRPWLRLPSWLDSIAWFCWILFLFVCAAVLVAPLPMFTSFRL